ncbi:CASP-like protein 2C1 [Citrus sinensis]|uniref:CASP-like protein 2C1 n=2 Tax=Citrus sinensis TaxID=2711 RepID=A0ACB8P754_CITSI|nr:CASP-like protein 2C1 [Citrus sinensis]KDO46524.1 hypothetical protein CISIN_1g030313mg [Citrus sinensis]
MDVQKIEAFVRVWAALLLLLTACLVGLDTQSKYIFYVDRKITYKELHALGALVYVASAAAGYNLLQLGRSVFVSRYLGNSKGSYRYLAWVSYLLDQVNFPFLKLNSVKLRSYLKKILCSKSIFWKQNTNCEMPINVPLVFFWLACVQKNILYPHGNCTTSWPIMV